MKKQLVTLGLIAGGAYIMGKVIWIVAEVSFKFGEMVGEVEATANELDRQRQESYYNDTYKATRRRNRDRRITYRTYSEKGEGEGDI